MKQETRENILAKLKALPTAILAKLKSFKFTKKTVKIIILVAILLAAAFGLYQLFFGGDDAVALTEFTSYGTLSSTISGSGTTTPIDTQVVTTASSADILGVYVSAGETVIEGQLLYIQDDSEVDDLILEYEEYIEDLNDTLTDYYETQSEYYESIAGAYVYAPYDGKVTNITIETGDNVNANTMLCTFTDTEHLEVTQYFGYEYQYNIYEGMTAYVSVADKMLLIEGTVSEIVYVDYISDTGNRCFAVTIAIDNPGVLTENLTVSAYVLDDDGNKIYPTLEGTLEYSNSETISAEFSTEVLGVYVANYQNVTAGTLLFSLDADDVYTQLESVESKIESTLSSIENYEEKIEDAEDSRSDYEVYAEISGTVISVGVTTSGRVYSGMSAVMIYSVETMQISANIDELDIENIYMYMPVTITYSTASNTGVYNGYISAISYEATNSNGVAYFPVTIEIESYGALSAGVNVDYAISIGDDEEGVLVPVSAVQSTDVGYCVFVKADSAPDNAVDIDGDVVPDGFYAVPIEVAASSSTYVVVKEGLTEDMELFTRYYTEATSGGDTTSSSGETTTDMMMPDMSSMQSGMSSGMSSSMSGQMGGR